MAYYQQDEKKLSFTDWKVYIDNSSQWYDDINKRIARAYTDTNLIKFIYPEIRTYTSSRKAQLINFSSINNKLIQVQKIIYSAKYKDLKQTGNIGDWDNKILIILDEVIQDLSMGLSQGELTPKHKKITAVPYEVENNAKDLINKTLTKNNNTSINKNGDITSNQN